MFADDALTTDGFLGGAVRILQPRVGYRAATDPVLLAASVLAKAGQSVLELGCGAGVASLCLAARVPGLQLWGVDVQPAYADLARRNAVLNGAALSVYEADIAALPAALRALRFDHVIVNPPYYPQAGGTGAADAGRETALREAQPLADWVAVGARRLAPGGWLTMIVAADRLPDVLPGFAAGLGAVAVLPLLPRTGRAAHRVILRGRKGARAPFRLMAGFVLHDGVAHDGDRNSYTEAARAVLRGGAPLEWGN